MEQFGIAVGAKALLVEILEDDVEVLHDGGFRLVLLVVDLFVEVGAEDVDEEEFMFYFEGGGRLKVVEVLYQQLLAEYEDGHVQVAGSRRVDKTEAVVTVILNHHRCFLDGGGQDVQLGIGGSVHMDVTFEEMAIDQFRQ